MEASWFNAHWFELVQTVGIVGGLLFTAVSLCLTATALHSETKTRRIANLLTLIENHRELWIYFDQSPHLSRVTDSSADVEARPVTSGEARFVNLVIQHTNGAFQAMQRSLVIKAEGMRLDVGSFLSLPIPSAVWKKVKWLQNSDFVRFIESCLEK